MQRAQQIVPHVYRRHSPLFALTPRNLRRQARKHWEQTLRVLLSFCILLGSLGTASLTAPSAVRTDDNQGGLLPGLSGYSVRDENGLIESTPLSTNLESVTSSSAASKQHGRIPVYFEANVGQTDPQVRFKARVRGADVFFTPNELVMVLPQPKATRAGGSKGEGNSMSPLNDRTPASVARLQFVEANAAPQLQAGEALPSRLNYFLGNDPTRWRTDVPTHNSITYVGLYPGVDLRYDSLDRDKVGQIKGTYTVAAGADPSLIRWRYVGAEEVLIDAAGNLQVRVAAPQGADGTGSTQVAVGTPITVTEQTPVSWQTINGEKRAVETRYHAHADGTIGFAIGKYDRTLPLIVDPTLSYSTYLGAGGDDYAREIAVNAASNAYVAGETWSSDFPTPCSPPLCSAYNGRANAFITKYNADGVLAFSTVMGGEGDDGAYGLALDSVGNIYLGGATNSDDFPMYNSYQLYNRGHGDLFFLKLNPSGSALMYSTFLGGNSGEEGGGEAIGRVAVDGTGKAYLLGLTRSTDIATTADAIQSEHNGGLYDMFVAKFDPVLSGTTSLKYATYLGGNGNEGFDYTGYIDEDSLAIAVNDTGEAFITGHTSSATNFPTYNPIQAANGGGYDAFVSRLNANGTQLLYSTYLGGSEDDYGADVKVNSDGYAYIVGETRSTNFPLNNPYQSTNHGETDVFVAALTPSGTALDFSTYLGGVEADRGRGMALDAQGDIYLTGVAGGEFPIRYPASARGGGADVFVTKMLATGQGLVYSTYLGGSEFDTGRSIAAGADGSAYLTGVTGSADFPTQNAHQASYNGLAEAFVTKLGPHVDSQENAELRCGGSPSQQPATLSAGAGVDTATGTYCHEEADLSVPGKGVPLMFARSYSSDMPVISRTVTTTLGYGWTHNYNMWIDRDEAGNYLVHEENGAVSTFESNFNKPIRLMATLMSTNGELVFTRVHGQTKFKFRDLDSSGLYRLVEIKDRNNLTTALTYTNGLLSTVTDPSNRSLVLTYNNGLLTQIRDNAFRRVKFAYDIGARQVMTDVGNQMTSYSYDADQRLEMIRYPNNGTLTTQYYEDGRVSQQTDPELRRLYFGYAGSTGGSLQTRMTDTLGLKTQHEYEDNLLHMVTERPGTGANERVWEYEYQPGTTWVALAKDPLLHEWRSTWDNAGNLLSETDSLSRVTRYGYNSDNDVTAITNTAGIVSTYNYVGSTGRLQSVSQPLTQTGQTVTINFSYSPSVADPTIITTTNPLNKKWENRLNTYGYITQSKDPLGYASTYVYDNVGRLTSATDPRGNPTQYLPNAYGNPARITDTLRYVTVYTYDSNQNPKTIKDPKNYVTTYDYNLNNEVKRITYHDGSYSAWTYDQVGRVYTQSNELRTVTQYAYDDINRVTTVTMPVTGTVNRVMRSEFDKVGNLKLARTTQGGQSNTSTYDYYDDNQLRFVDYADPNTPDVEYFYNSRGLRERMAGGDGNTTYGYDSLNRIRWVQQGNGGRVDYTYDLADNLTQILYPPDEDNQRRPVVRTFYDNNWMRTTTDFGTATPSEFLYDRNGNMTDVVYPQSTGRKMHTDYDAANRPFTITHSINNVPITLWAYVRDQKGMVSTVTEKRGTPLVPRSVQAYAYDNRDRLRTITATVSITNSVSATTVFTYDRASQLLDSKSVPGLGFGGEVLTTTNRYNLAGELQSLQERSPTTTTKHLSYTYDLLGNRTSETNSRTGTLLSTYRYDGASRLVEYDYPLAGRWGNYTYNGDGLRSTKQASTNPYSVPTLSYTWDLVGGGSLPLAIADTGAQYVYGPGGRALAMALDHAPTSPQMLPGGEAVSEGPGQPDELEALGQPYYYMWDQQGNITDMVSASGIMVADYAYDAWGRRKCRESNCTVWYNPMGYNGQQQDEESGLVYLRARYYDPHTQQFISRDPMVGLTGQPYVYANNNPVNANDTNGMFLDWLFDGASVALDIKAIFDEGLNWGNGMTLLADIGLAVLPFVPSGAGHVARGGKAIGAACSFSADTPIATEDGLRSISELEVGDRVLAYNEATDNTGYYTVTAVLVHEDPGIEYLTIDGERLETTPEHPFYTQESGWVAAGELWPGTHIRKADGSYGVVEQVRVVQRTQRMYNLTVAVAHTFFVGEEGWLVHNTCGWKTLDIGKHGQLGSGKNRAPGHSSSPTDHRVQSHHIVQDKWATRNIANYNSDEAAAMLLPTGSGRAHTIITNRQNARSRALGANWAGQSTLRQQLNYAYGDLLAAGVPKRTAQKAVNKAIDYFTSIGAYP